MMQCNLISDQMGQFNRLLALAAFLLALGLAPGCAPKDEGSSQVAAPAEPPQPPPAQPQEPIDTRLIRSFEILPHKAACASDKAKLCYVLQTNETETALLYENIEGFNWQWGKRYVIDVEELEAPEPPVDGPFKIYKLVEIVDQQPAPEGSTFEMDIDREFLNPGTDCVFSLMGTKFTTRDQNTCDLLNLAISARGIITARFSHTSSADKPLLLESIQSSTHTNLTWTELSIETRETSTGECKKPELLILKPNSNFELTGCHGFTSGQLDRADFKKIDDLAEFTSDLSLNFAPNCERSRQKTISLVSLTLNNGHRRTIYRTNGKNELCFRGEEKKSVELQETLEQLAKKLRPTPLPLPQPIPPPPPSDGAPRENPRETHAITSVAGVSAY